MSDLGAVDTLLVVSLGLERSATEFPGSLIFTKGEYHQYFGANRRQGPAGTAGPARHLGWVGLQVSAKSAGGVYLSRS